MERSKSARWASRKRTSKTSPIFSRIAARSPALRFFSPPNPSPPTNRVEDLSTRSGPDHLSHQTRCRLKKPACRLQPQGGKTLFSQELVAPSRFLFQPLLPMLFPLSPLVFDHPRHSRRKS